MKSYRHLKSNSLLIKIAKDVIELFSKETTAFPDPKIGRVFFNGFPNTIDLFTIFKEMFYSSDNSK